MGGPLPGPAWLHEMQPAWWPQEVAAVAPGGKYRTAA